MTGSVDHFYYQTCDWCKSADLRVDIRAGDVICTNCGSVQQSRILDANDEMIIHEEERSSKLGRAAGLVSAYGGTDTLFLNGEESLCRSLERAQKAALSSTERMISKYIYLLSDVCTALDLPPSVKEESVRLFVIVHQEKVLSIRSHQPAVAAACVFLACRLSGYPRLIEEISHGCDSLRMNIETTVIHRMQAEIARHLLVANDRGSGNYGGLRTLTKAADLYFRFATRLQHSLALDNYPSSSSSSRSMFSAAMKESGRTICERLDELELSSGDGRTPQLVVAVILAWLAVLVEEGPGVPVTRIASTCFVTPGQLVSHAMKFYPSLRMVLSAVLLERLDAMEVAVMGSMSALNNSFSEQMKRSVAGLFNRSDSLIMCPLIAPALEKKQSQKLRTKDSKLKKRKADELRSQAKKIKSQS